MTTILIKTKQLAQSAEVNDHVVVWLNTLSSSARERTKLQSLGDDSYLRSFQGTLVRINEVYAEIEQIHPEPTAASTRALRDLHAKNLQYLKLLDQFSKQQSARVRAPINPRNTELVKEIDLDTITNEAFKGYEHALREGLFQTQEVMRWERNDKLMSLRNSVRRAKDRLFYSLFLLLAMVAYVAVILKWKILDPMKILKTGVVEIGKGNLGYQVNVKARNEIGELSDVFNHMSLQLDQKRNAEVRLKRLEAIEQVVRSVNHEINNPLMIISGNAEYLLAIQENSDEGIKSKLNSIVSEVRRIFMVTQRLKEIKEPVTENYIGNQDQMIDLMRSSQFLEKDP